MKVEKDLLCIVCPVGCRMLVTVEGEKVLNVTGNTCKRGISYAEDECIAPKRVLTSTVVAFIQGQKKMAPVKTSQPIPKELLFKAMDMINDITLTESQPCGNVVIKNILDTGADIILTSDI